MNKTLCKCSSSSEDTGHIDKLPEQLENTMRVTASGRKTKFRNTERKLIEGFLDYIASVPFSEMTVAGLCKISGVGRNTFYDHHPDLLSLADECVRNLMGRCDLMPSQAGHPGWNIEKTGEPLCLAIRNDRRYASLMFDPTISERCIALATELSLESTVKVMLDRTYAKEEPLRIVCSSSLRGCLQSIKDGLDKSDAEWGMIKDSLDMYNRGGLRLISLF